jgi:integrase
VPRAGFEPASPALGSSGKELAKEHVEKILEKFKAFLEVDKLRKPATIANHIRTAKRLMEKFEVDPSSLTVEEIRAFLAEYRNGNPNTYANVLKSLRMFFEFLGKKEVVMGFKYPRVSQPFNEVVKDEDLRKFYHALESPHDRAFFLVLATSGLRYGEAAGLKVEEIDFSTGMVVPHKNEPRAFGTKNTYITFVNREALEALKQYLAGRGCYNGVIFNELKGKSGIWYRWSVARQRSGTRVRPKDLRVWFAWKMGCLGVPDRYIDAFCGRVPRSVLARHYTDYSPERLKEIYDRANLKVLA